jgi:hypothetical protein
LVATVATEVIMAAKEIAVKKCVVRLSGEERDRLEVLFGVQNASGLGYRR